MKRMHLIAATALCGLTFGLSPVPSAHAPGQPILTGKAGGVLVDAWIDDSKGTRTDTPTAQQFEAAFAGSDWSIDGDNTMVITKDGGTLLTAAWISVSVSYGSQEVPYLSGYLIHSAAARQFVDGMISQNVDPNDPSRGLAVLYLTQVSSDGKSYRSMRILVDLTFSDGGGGRGGGGGIPGF